MHQHADESGHELDAECNDMVAAEAEYTPADMVQRLRLGIPLSEVKEFTGMQSLVCLARFTSCSPQTEKYTLGFILGAPLLLSEEKAQNVAAVCPILEDLLANDSKSQ